ncbi:MAG: serine hydrolase [Bacteroidota bacterium]|jgi:CubicO group peptidase (beta-lactamase class C family)
MKKSTGIRTLLLFSLGILFSPHVVRAQIAAKELDAYIQDVQKEFEVPGLALAIVKDGKVVIAKGYGVRKMGEAAKVDDQTLFGIASNTKAFTATALGLLVEEGKLEWDAPVVKYLPWFQLSDPYVTREITIRDLLVHRSGLGLGAGDLLWWPTSTYDRKEIAKRLKSIPLVRSFRSAYAYDNVLYLIAGEVIEAVGGMSWEDFMASRILAKVGMTDSKVRHSDAAGNGNIAATHASVDGKVRPIEPFTSDNTNPAGGINASARDIAKWMIVQLDSGRVAGSTRLFSPQTTVQLWQMVTPMPTFDPPPELEALRTNFNGYALGFKLSDYQGCKFVFHTGDLPGYVSKIAMIPGLKLGVAVLTNQESDEARESITYHVLDEYLPGKKTDWLGAYKKMHAQSISMNEMADNITAAKRDSTSHPSLPLASYAGTYNDQWYGDINILFENGKLVMKFGHTPSLEGELQHWQFDTFIARWKDRELRADAFITFALTPDGSIDEAKMRAVSPATDFSFDFQDLLLKPVKRPGR